MREYIVNRPDETAMRRLLAGSGPESVVLRLAWQAGLSRDEISALTWDQVSFLNDRLELPDRMVPLDPDLRPALWRLHENGRETAPQVVLSSRGKTPLRPESISRLARQALDREGQTNVRLMDLRHDWIIRQLEDKDWAAVARISGVEIPALQARFAAYVPRKPLPSRPSAPVDEFKLRQVLQTEKDTPAGLALCLTWQSGLQAREIVALTWSQVDFARGCLRLPDREVPLTGDLRRMLEETRCRAPEGEDHVLLTERSRKPLDLPRLSRLTRSALIRGGMEQTLPRDLRKDESREDEDQRLLDAARQGPLSRSGAAALLGISKSAAHGRLRCLTERNELVRVGGKYYLPGTVVPPERQWETVRAYLERSGSAYRQDIAGVLQVRPKQCAPVLRRMVDAGWLARIGQKYYLPQDGKFQTE
jgi:integrase